MNLHQFFVGRAIGFYAILMIAGIVAGFYALNNYIYEQKQGDPTDVQPYRASLEGEYICLDDETDTCTKGLVIDDGSRYTIDFMLMSQTAPELEVGDRIRANGVITPAERLSTVSWQSYNIEGIFNVTDSVEIIEE